MNTQKIAITMPKSLVKMIDKISSVNGVSRSKFISTVLYEKLLDEKKKNIINAYNSVFSDESILEEQLETAKWFGNANSEEGQEW